MNEIEEIVRDRVVLELQILKEELGAEIKRLQLSRYTDDNLVTLEQVKGIEIAIGRIERRILERRNK